jgi:hypothetical protein
MKGLRYFPEARWAGNGRDTGRCFYRFNMGKSYQSTIQERAGHFGDIENKQSFIANYSRLSIKAVRRNPFRP